MQTPTERRRSGRVLRVLAVSLPLLILIVACTGGPAQVPGPLRVATNVWLGYEPLYLARRLGYLPDETIRLVELPSTTDIMHALRTGTIEAAGLTLDEFLGLRAEGLDLRVALVFDASLGADALVARSDVATLADLRGRRVGVEQSAVGLVVLDAALKAGGLSMSDVEMVAVTLDQHLDAFGDGRVDAIVTFEPVLTHVRRNGGKVLFDTSRMPDRIVDLLVVRADVLDDMHEPLRMLVRAWFDALRYFEDNPAQALEGMQARQRLSVEELADSLGGLRLADLDENRRMLLGESPLLRQNAEDMAAFMLERGLLPIRPSLADMIDTQVLPW